MSELQSLVDELEPDPSLDDPARLRERVAALDRLESLGVGDQGLPGDAEQSDEAALRRRAAAVQNRLEQVNRRLFEAIRRDIRRGAGATRLLPWAQGLGKVDDSSAPPEGDGYDELDVLVSGVLRLEEPATRSTALSPEMVPYQPTPARHIFDLIRRAGLNDRDVLVDLGSGLGHLPLLVASCTAATSIGIELEAAYVACARRCAAELNLSQASFVQQDVRAADLSRGTLYYLYTPFVGTVLREVLDALRREAQQRPVRIATYGPCTAIVAAERWLEVTGTVQVNRVSLLRSQP